MKIIKSALLLAFAALVSLPLTGCGSSSTQTIPLTETIFYAHTILFGNHSTLVASGYNAYGQLGDGSLNGSSSFHQVTTATGMTTVSGYSAGANHSLAFHNYTVWSWGSNFQSRLGVGTTVPDTGITAYSARPLPIVMHSAGTDSPVTAVAAGWVHSLALKGDTVWSWGDNTYGELGNSTSTSVNPTLTPSPVLGVGGAGTTLSGIGAIAAGGGHSLALSSDKMTIYAWGYNNYGQAGQGPVAPAAAPTFEPTPKPVALPSDVAGIPYRIAAAGSYSLVLLDNGDVLGWGFNGYGQLGNKVATPTRDPVYVPVHVVTADGRQLNDPANTATMGKVVQISAGTMFVLARTDKGKVYAWGYNLKGQLGTGTNELNITYAVPATTINAVADANFPGVTDILAVGDTSLAKIGNTWYGWGDYGWGQLGLPVPNNAVAYLLEPMAIPMPQ
ncbi:hypothetical protein GMSM_12010 [Geomonas sp. Red276]